MGYIKRFAHSAWPVKETKWLSGPVALRKALRVGQNLCYFVILGTAFDDFGWSEGSNSDNLRGSWRTIGGQAPRNT